MTAPFPLNINEQSLKVKEANYDGIVEYNKSDIFDCNNSVMCDVFAK